MLHLFYIYAECVPEDSLIPRNVRGITHVTDREWYCAMESECSAAARADLVACGIDRYHVRHVCMVPDCAKVDASVCESGTYVHLLRVQDISPDNAARGLGVRKITHVTDREWYCAIETDGSVETLLSCCDMHNTYAVASVHTDDFKNTHDYMYAFSAPLATMEEVADATAEISRDACDVYSSPYGNGVYGVGRACAPQHRIREAIGALPGATVTIYRPTGDDARRALSDFSAHFQKHA